MTNLERRGEPRTKFPDSCLWGRGHGQVIWRYILLGNSDATGAAGAFFIAEISRLWEVAALFGQDFWTPVYHCPNHSPLSFAHSSCTDLWRLEHVRISAWLPTFFFFPACSILIPWPGIKSRPLQWKHGGESLLTCVTNPDLAQLQVLLSCCLLTISTWMLKGISNITCSKLNSSCLRFPGGITNSENGSPILPTSWPNS